MTDPERLSRSPNRSLAALLLRAAAEEKPSKAVLNRTSAAVSALASVASQSAASLAPAVGVKHAAVSGSKLAASTSAATAGTSFTGTTLGVGAVAKWIAVGALGGAVAMSSVQALLVEQGSKQVDAIPTATPNASFSKPIQRSTAVAPTAPEPVASAAVKESERRSVAEAQKSPNAATSQGELVKPEAAARTESAFLAAEVRFVDQGRAALQRAAFAEALEQLAPYEALFPHQQLLTEVLFLRMEAFSRLKDVDRARALAARILTLGVTGRQAAQAREILGP